MQIILLFLFLLNKNVFFEIIELSVCGNKNEESKHFLFLLFNYFLFSQLLKSDLLKELLKKSIFCLLLSQLQYLLTRLLMQYILEFWKRAFPVDYLVKSKVIVEKKNDFSQRKIAFNAANKKL